MGSQKENSQPEVIEGEQKWEQDFSEKFVKDVEDSGKVDWSKYTYTRNRLSPSGPALDLSKTKLLFISTAGTYLKDSQEPFDDKSMLGDYSLRRIPTGIKFEDLAIAHDHYDHKYINADPEVLLPFGHLQDLLNEEKLGSLASEWISISGYQPNIVKIKRKLAPEIIKIAKELEVQATFLVPA
jgi:hypothetical protein